MPQRQAGHLVIDQVNHNAFLVEDGKLESAIERYTDLVHCRAGLPMALVTVEIVRNYDRFREHIERFEEDAPLTVVQLARLTGLSDNLLRQWVHDGIIRASLPVPQGSESGQQEEQFSRWDGFICWVASFLLQAGCDRKTLLAATRTLYGQHWLGRKVDLGDGQDAD